MMACGRLLAGCRPSLAVVAVASAPPLSLLTVANCVVALLQTWNAWFADGMQATPDDLSPISGLIANCAGRNAVPVAVLEVGWAWTGRAGLHVDVLLACPRLAALLG